MVSRISSTIRLTMDHSTRSECLVLIKSTINANVKLLGLHALAGISTFVTATGWICETAGHIPLYCGGARHTLFGP